MCFIDFNDFICKIRSVKILKKSERANMGKRQKNTSILSYFVKQRRKESTEIKEHEQETDSSRPSCSSSASQSIEFDSAKKHRNLGRPNVASRDIAKILPLYRSNNVDKLQLITNAFRPVGETAMAFDYKKCCTAKDNDFVISTKFISEHIHGWSI